ncbi:inverse autotransporter beta domain-containing protein [Enterobacter mori]|uniref:inverse autotransporter beta domain-containing protein n=1 Tax=Enterobacter mori TaxID=539813 RepID=UPI003D2EA033
MKSFFSENRFKKVSLLNIILQLNVSLAPTLMVIPTLAQERVATKPYILSQGETAKSVADKLGITISELQKINQFRTFSNGFASISEGMEIDVPAINYHLKSLAVQSSDNQPDTVFANWAAQTGSFFSTGSNINDAANLARSIASERASQEIQTWLGKNGTAKVNLNTDQDFSLKGSSVDMLYPLYENNNNIFFTQAGWRDADERSQTNVGFGIRHFGEGELVGGNIFYDHDISRGHKRLGLGAEYWRDYIKFGANAYLGLSGWKDSEDIEDYEERTADGWDIRAEGYLPAYPQIGGKLQFEQYYGDKVGLFGDTEENLQKDPYAITAGLIYTPIQLVSLNADYKSGKSGKDETEVGLSFNYSFGVPFKEQINSDAVAFQKTLMGSKYDLVDRNNNIILEYRKKEVIKLKTASLVTGRGGENKSLNVSVTSKHGLKEIKWSAESLLANGGKIVRHSADNYSVILPAYSATETNSYTVTGIAYDKKSNASSASETQVSVLKSRISQAASTFTPLQSYLPSDGSTKQILTLHLRDEQSNSIPIDVKQISLIVEREQLLAKVKKSNNTGEVSLISSFKQKSPGIYEVVVKAGLTTEDVILTPVVEGSTLTSAKVTIGGTPIVKDLKIEGLLEVGASLSGTYKFHANGGEPTDTSLYLWGHQGQTAGGVAGSSTTVSTSGSVPAYTLAAGDAGQVMELSVQAKNGANMTGNIQTVNSSMTGGEGNGTDGGNGGGGVIDPAAGPQISNLNIAGTLEVGQVLSGTYTFAANGGEPTDTSLYLWGHQGQTAGGVAGSSTTVSTSGSVPAYTLAAGDAGQVMELSVQAKNGANMTGNIQTVNSSMTGGEGNGTGGGNGGGGVIDPAAGPQISNLNIAGTLEVGQVLSGTYTFAANGGEPTDTSLYLWGHQGQTAGGVAGSSTTVSTSGSVPAYTLAAGDAGQVMELSVQAKNGANMTGNIQTVNSSMTGGEGNGTGGGNGGGGVIDPAAGPQISNLNIAGTLEVGQVLSGTYTFAANGGEPTDTSLYLWGHQGQTAGGVAGSSTTVSTSGSVPAYTLAAGDAGQVMELSVQAKNGANMTGNIQTVNSSMTGGEGNGTDGGNGGGGVIDPAAGPQISNLNIAGTLEVGQVLSGTYTFAANGGEPTDTSLYLWGHQGQTAGGVAGSSTTVSTSGSVPAYTLAAGDAGQVMELSVQAKNGANMTGNIQTVNSSMTGGEGNGTDGGNGGGGVIDPAAGPQISNLNIAGTLEVGQVLSGTYTFAANGGEPTDTSLYLWGHQGQTAGGVAGSSTTVSTSGSVPAYTLAAGDAGQVMELSVQAKNGANVTGNTETKDTSAAVELPVLNVSVDKIKVKKGEAIQLTVETKYQNGESAADVAVTVKSLEATNRQNVAQTVSATINGENTFSGQTDIDGKLVVEIKDDSTLGLKTKISVMIGTNQESEKTQDVIFTVLTSPDTPVANFWGHMVESYTVNGVTFKRPELAAEVSGTGTKTVNNEVYARFNYEAANAYCPNLAPIEELEALGREIAHAENTVGWPAPTIPNPQGYRSSSDDGIGGHWNIDMNDGERGTNVDSNISFVACKQ